MHDSVHTPDGQLLARLRQEAGADPALVHLGVTLLSLDGGGVTVRLPVRAGMTNALGIVHGGYAFTVADCAFAYACIAAGRRSVTHHADLTYLSAVTGSAHLDATGTLRHAYGRNTIVDVEVRDDSGSVVAHGRVHGRSVGEPFTRHQAEEDHMVTPQTARQPVGGER